MTVTRFAPSPTGDLHLGHAFAALFAADQAGKGGRFLVRIEDIDPGRCRPGSCRTILEDMRWLGLEWEEPVRCQSQHLGDYEAALRSLEARNLLYPCFCTRSDIRHEIEMAGYAPHDVPGGPDGPHYPGTCRSLSKDESMARIAHGDAYALRLDMARAVQAAGPLSWCDRGRGDQNANPGIFGDVVLARKDVPTSYHLAVTLDDHLQEVALVTRGEDLFLASHLHRLLQALLGLDTPEWWHHPLLCGPDGKRFAKRDRAVTLRALRESGHTPGEIRRDLGFP